jgi:hypothetical protein
MSVREQYQKLLHKGAGRVNSRKLWRLGKKQRAELIGTDEKNFKLLGIKVVFLDEEDRLELHIK